MENKCIISTVTCFLMESLKNKYDPQIMFISSLFKRGYQSVSLQHICDRRHVPDRAISVEFNPLMFLLQPAAKATERKRPLARQNQSV